MMSNYDMFEMRGSSRSSRPRSLCARCGNIREGRQQSPGRGSWREKGRELSLEVHGREGRRRNSSSESSNGRQRTSPLHCYIVPNGSTPTTTYSESFRSPTNQPLGIRHSKSVPSSPASASPLWSPMSASPRSTPIYRQDNTQALLSKVPARLQNALPAAGKPSNTTYRDHFTWLS